MKIIGPFTQIVTLNHLPLKGSIKDESLEIMMDSGIAVEGDRIKSLDKFDLLKKKYPETTVELIETPQVLLPGFIDNHTHICFAGNRAKDYAMRISGKSYQEIAKAGGGIWDTVMHIRNASKYELVRLTAERANKLLHAGITTIEVKSGYGLNVEEELKILRAIKEANRQTKADLISTCLAAHIKPKDFEGTEEEYLLYIEEKLLPKIKKENLAKRVDIFVEEAAFGIHAAKGYLQRARQLGFDCTVHADQFTTGGSVVAIDGGAVSADHLEASGNKEIRMLADADIVATVLPGASLGLGMPFAPARKLLDAGASVAIASDWNPGSAPMGDLLIQASVLGAYERLSIAEMLAGVTFRAVKALRLNDKGILKENFLADMQAYPVKDYREIFYLQGSLKPNIVWKNGERI
ncbi:imidazolonepropionase [Arachidicoccus soli]|uniref:Imidazolonepropionase n=1 Tax=Arachidicoccus soli TaxID=2341117 RepID=A0A386HMU1_9BACT|nr:imidazolonepropionase [Arachidicoccus soli]AYD46811.1 imidazolonepropionase [Arachidicoccus soli]